MNDVVEQVRRKDKVAGIVQDMEKRAYSMGNPSMMSLRLVHSNLLWFQWKVTASSAYHSHGRYFARYEEALDYFEGVVEKHGLHVEDHVSKGKVN